MPILVILFSLFFIQLHAQKEATNWYFGTYAGIRFEGCKPVQLTDGKMETFEGCATISDAQGNLLYYTNGGGRLPIAGNIQGSIWNADHDILYDMMGTQGGGFSAAQSAVFIPKPDAADRYLLFTMEEAEFDVDGDPVDRGLSWFEIDKTLNGGKGGVVIANQNLHKPAFEGLAAALHQNGKDYWVIALDDDTNNFVVVPVTADGPGTPTLYDGGLLEFPGTIKIAPDRRWLTVGGYLYQFDPETGMISGGDLLTFDGVISYSFSPNSRFLYLIRNAVSGKSLWRYHLDQANIPASGTKVTDLPTSSFFGPMQLGPDGHIYLLEAQVTALQNIYLARIHCPNAEQVFFETELMAFPTDPSFGIFLGLPNFSDHLFQDERDVPFTLDLGGDTLYLCPGSSLTLDAGILPSDSCNVSVLGWSTGSTESSIDILEPGLYSVTVAAFCGKLIDSVVVLEGEPTLSLNLASADTLLCAGDTLFFVPNTQGASTYQWSTGDTTPTLATTLPGTYYLTVTNNCGTSLTDSVQLSLLEKPIIQAQLDTGLYCTENLVTLQAYVLNGPSPVYSDGELLDSQAVTPGDFLTLTAENTCGTTLLDLLIPVPDCSDCFAMPNVFSPNNDGLNDTFAPVIRCPDLFFSIQIFSRFGEKIFESQDSQGWDGNLQPSGTPAQPDVYIYQVNIRLPQQESLLLTDEFLLLR